MKIPMVMAAFFLICTKGHVYSRKEAAVDKIKRAYAAWNEAVQTKDVEAFTALNTDDIVYLPPDAKPLSGKKAVRRRTSKAFRTSSNPSVLTFEGIALECGDSFVVRHTGRQTAADGRVLTTSGVRIMTIENGVAKVKLSIYNRDSPKEEPTKQPSHPVYPYNNYYYQGYSNYYNSPGHRRY